MALWFSGSWILLIWILLPESGASVVSHYEAACFFFFTPEEQQSRAGISSAVKALTSQRQPIPSFCNPPPQTLADDRGAMQPADWPTEPPVRADLERRRKRHKRLRTESIMISSLGLCDWVPLINGYMTLHRTQ